MRVLVPGRQRQIPEVRQLRHQADGVFNFGGLQAIGPQKFIHGNADWNGAAVTHGLFRFLDHFAKQAGPVFERAAIFIASHIGGAREKLLENAKAVPGIDIDEIITGGAGAECGSAVGAAQVFDIFLVHGPGLNRTIDIAGSRHGRRANWNLARPQVHRCMT